MYYKAKLDDKHEYHYIKYQSLYRAAEWEMDYWNAEQIRGWID